MTSALNADSLRVHDILKLLHGLLGEISAILNIPFANMTEETIQEVLAESYGASIIHDEEAIPLENEEVALN